MAWKKGPLPAGTYNWGGVVKVGDDPTGFYFADFNGDHAEIDGPDGPDGTPVRVEADQIAWYDNSLELPPSGVKRAR